MHPRQTGVVINGDKPPVKENPRRAGLGHFHQMKGSGGVVQNRIDENFQIGKFECECFGIVNQVERGGDDGLEVL